MFTKFAYNIIRTSFRSLALSAVSRTEVELTSVRYPDLKRGPYSTLESSDLTFFKNILGESRVITDESEIASYNTDWMKSCRGTSSLLLRPKTSEEVSKILAYCNNRKLAVCPQGGNTGLVGGSVPVFDEVILSLSLMNQISSFDPITGVLQCDAGCVLGNLETFVHEQDYVIPIDLGAKGSCQIGGNVATNAGGIRLFRYGSLLGNVLGLEIVLSSGTVLNLMNPLRKDNTGYNLKHIFIGSEGTLGIITKVALLCPTKPISTSVAFLGCTSFDNLLSTFKVCKQKLSVNLLSFEMLDNDSMDAVENNLKAKNPLSSSYPFYIVLEISGSCPERDEEKLISCMEELMEKNLIEDGTITSDLSRIQKIWFIREQIAEALLHDGYCYKYDISLPLAHFYGLVDHFKTKLASRVTRCCGYGHIGDGNVHFNVTTPSYSKDVFNILEPEVYEWTAKHNGSVSAEHGLGLKKRNFIYFSKPPDSVEIMKQFKAFLDPNQILNPYKVLPS